jgi:hypothetical protein
LIIEQIKIYHHTAIQIGKYFTYVYNLWRNRLLW